MNAWTPKQIVEQLDQYIVGQQEAKRSVAVALRNRYRRSQLDEALQQEVTPKNILMIGPTGVGKTEIARRIATLVGAPFIKVEATKFTEVGYVGRDVESMVRDLVEEAYRLVQKERMAAVRQEAKAKAEERLVQYLVPKAEKQSSQMKNPFEMIFQQQEQEEEEPQDDSLKEQRRRMAHQLALGEIEDRLVTIEVEESQGLSDMFQGSGMEQMGMNMQQMFGQMMPKKKKTKRLSVAKARNLLTDEEARHMVDEDEISQEAVSRTEQLGIVFLDEIDKVTGSNKNNADVSREGVQRDILPIVEGAAVNTKYGVVRTDHMLFIAAGAFHMSKPSDLIPELQGRFPVRVELESLSSADFSRILKEPDNALLKQYTALLATEGIEVEFSDEAVTKLAELAADVNQATDNIGARRLHTLLERLLEELSFEAPDINMSKIPITPEYVEEKLASITKDKDMSQFIL
ncbi:ATP-dependent HslUV protease ATP-binding subunit HslU [Salsuginibacillus halophilus]|uniref:ATP-dependent protease ATPase subunit HslU n=1 Tax=Salsuginibacillus halophilus TaxID=517424 RepID=A0A2P8HY66_9BACI|nr:ATP-dependent protease ATPase subunit HslU [Salsuginibacillus halophilus]PSL51182.1 ATP-dependent HslUV protease ATP-binding subunit HslU [Salsuginibacillus halophilus]